MIKFKIPVVDLTIKLCAGREGWKEYSVECKKLGFSPEEIGSEYPDKGSGRQVANIIWVDSFKDKRTIYHETVHLIDSVMEHLVATKECEFRAFLGAYILEKILTIVK